MDFAKRDMLVFAREHAGEDTARLLLSATRYPGIDIEAAVQQIEGGRTAKEKWPSLADCREYLYPPRLNREQASSEVTARFKKELLLQHWNGKRSTVADLTGGMGIDSLAFASAAEYVDYVELDEGLCRTMEHNCRVLGIDNIRCHCDDSMVWLAAHDKHYNTIFIDPARRDGQGRKMAAFADCTPDILQHLPLLTSHCDMLMVKASPMMDIDRGVAELGCVAEVHVVAVKGECKELLFLCSNHESSTRIHCHNITSDGDSHFSFTRDEESAATSSYCTQAGRYLFEPDAALMKGAPFKLLSDIKGLMKLAPNTHLYTGDTPVPWSGRIFTVLQETSLSRKALSSAIPDKKAHMIVRNYPADVATLRKQTGLSEGGELFVIATTVGNSKKAFICREEKQY